MAKDSAWLCQLGGGWCGFGELCRYRGGKLDADCGGVAAWPHRATATARRRRRGDRLVTGDVRYWPKADIASCTAHVRFRGQSGHGLSQCTYLLMTQSGHHSANPYNQKKRSDPSVALGIPACTGAASEQEGSACSHKFQMQMKCQCRAALEVHGRGPTLAKESTSLAPTEN
jgi:hypothetical protein